MNLYFPLSNQNDSSSHFTFPNASGNSSSSSNSRIQEVSSRSLQSTSSTFPTIPNGQPDGYSWVDSSSNPPPSSDQAAFAAPWADHSGVLSASQVGGTSLSFPQTNSYSSALSDTSTFPVSGSQTHLPFFQQAVKTDEIGREIFTPRSNNSSSFLGLGEAPPPSFPAPSPNSCSSSAHSRNQLWAFDYFEEQLEEGREIVETNGQTLTKKIVLYIFRTFISDFAEQDLSNDGAKWIESNVRLSIELVKETLLELGEKNNPSLLNEIRDQLKTNIIPELKDNIHLLTAISQYFQRNGNAPNIPLLSAHNLANDPMSFSLSAARLLEEQMPFFPDFTEMPDSEVAVHSLDTIFDLEIQSRLPQDQRDLAMSVPPSSSGQKPIRTLESATEITLDNQSSDSGHEPSTAGASSSSSRLPSQKNKRKLLSAENASEQSKKNRQASRTGISKGKTERLVSYAASSNPNEADGVPLELIVQQSIRQIIEFQKYLLETKNTRQNQVKEIDEKIEKERESSPEKIKNLYTNRSRILKRSLYKLKNKVKFFIGKLSKMDLKYLDDGISCLKLSGYVFHTIAAMQLRINESNSFKYFIKEIKDQLITIIKEDKFKKLLDYFEELIEPLKNQPPVKSKRRTTNATISPFGIDQPAALVLERPMPLPSDLFNSTFTENLDKIPPISVDEIPPIFIPKNKNSTIFKSPTNIINRIAIAVSKKELTLKAYTDYKTKIRKIVTELIISIANSPSSTQEDFFGFYRYARKIYRLLEKQMIDHTLSNSKVNLESVLNLNIPFIKKQYDQLVEESASDDEASEPEPFFLPSFPSTQ